MCKIDALERKLSAQGLECKRITLVNLSDGRERETGIMVIHDYEGIYPTAGAIAAHETAAKIARRNGWTVESRASYVSTLLLPPVRA